LLSVPPYLRASRIVLTAAIAAGCSSGARPSVTEIADGGLSYGPCDINSVCTPDPFGFCQHTCTPDPGPRLVNCAQPEQNFTFFDPPIWTFEELVAPPPLDTPARSMYSYTDNTTTIRTFTKYDNNNPNHRPKQTWQPRTAVLPRCSDKPNDQNHAIHIQGGPFLSWGGGVGIGMKNFPNLIGTVETPEALAPFDFTGWEGISFWARRGPDSQAGFRVLAGDKYTDDDVSYIMYRNDPTQPRYCERVRECGCLDHHSCVAVHLDPDATGETTNPIIPTGCTRAASHNGDTQVMKFCGTPREISGAEGGQGSACNLCSESRCDDWWPAFPDDCANPGGDCSAGDPTGADRQYHGKPCSPYTMRNGVFGYWCFDPSKGERPAEPPEQCGDHWTRVVNLSTEWQFYTVPFNAMAQQGWAKRSAGLDLKSISVFRFTWDGGWVDFWIDDVRLYKRKQQ
jgi:hypothetical protein